MLSLMVGRARLHAIALATSTAARLAGISVRAVERVAMRAVRFAGVLRCPALAAQDVHAVSNRLQVGRVDARPVATQVIQGQSIGNWPAEQLPCEPMRHHGPAVGGREAAVAAGEHAGGPVPALAVGAPGDLCPEAIRGDGASRTSCLVALHEPSRLPCHRTGGGVAPSSDVRLLAASAPAAAVRDILSRARRIFVHRGKGLLSRCHGTGRLAASRSPLVACNCSTLPHPEVTT